MAGGRIVDQSPIGFDATKVQQITDMLNANIATLFQLHKQFKKHYWYMSGTEYVMLAHCFEAWSERALEDADELALRVVAVGGVPIDPTAFESAAAFQFEAAGVPTVRQMVLNDLAAEQALFKLMRPHIPTLDSLGDHASSIQLRHVLKEQESIARKLALYTQADGLAWALMQGQAKP